MTRNDATVDFETYRPMLLGLAYRLLGSMWDAEDVVQEAWLRWSDTDQAAVKEPRAFLVTIVSRLALDQLRSARVKREAYTGPWLPEPVSASEVGPLDTAELRDTLSYATLHLMERLSPPERAVFVLREAFDLPYDEIASIVDASVANCRQMHHRASVRLAQGRDRFQPSPEDHARLLLRFLDAAQGGDLAALTSMLSDDVAAWTDGGGKVRAALHPIEGREKVAAFIAGLIRRYGVEETRIVDVNGAPGLWIMAGGQPQVATVAIRNGLIRGIYAMRNPDKLGRGFPQEG
ncbi:RNA polymerase sigma-70 factor [Nonomuraea dietziae]|uniref:RNA polymerase sigma-70 factor (ECF subfamily) n=1 Tax=Nonomuraea dietziae TaxID=65515 RepID=A0A7W5V8J2_9ACTN|nr:RNA polymerase sigma-70 factor [Nonomuraea dietziae]MBB3731294.1 RNA polymerase sigma-70 factor (ECF subfamily) [Nonomuraea dietziae]